MRVTLKDIADKLGLSKSAISRYMNNDPKLSMSAETKKRIDDAIREMNYKPSPVAKAFRSGKTQIIGVTLAGITDHFSSHVAEAVLYFCDIKNYQTLLSLSTFDTEKEYKSIKTLLDRQVDGILATNKIPDRESQIGKELSASGIKIVLFNREEDETPSVNLDRIPAISDMIKSFTRRGHTAFMIVNYSTDEVLREGIAELSRKHGIIPDFFNLADSSSLEPIAQEISEKRPGAIYFRDCKMLISVCDYLREAKINGYSPDIVTSYNLAKDEVPFDLVVGILYEKFYDRISFAMDMLFREINGGIREDSKVLVTAKYYPIEEFLALKNKIPGTIKEFLTR